MAQDGLTEVRYSYRTHYTNDTSFDRKLPSKKLKIQKRYEKPDLIFNAFMWSLSSLWITRDAKSISAVTIAARGPCAHLQCGDLWLSRPCRSVTEQRGERRRQSCPRQEGASFVQVRSKSTYMCVLGEGVGWVLFFVFFLIVSSHESGITLLSALNKHLTCLTKRVLWEGGSVSCCLISACC